MAATDRGGRDLLSSSQYGAFFKNARQSPVPGGLGALASPLDTVRSTGPLSGTHTGRIGARSGAAYRPRVLCPETRYAEALLTASRHFEGHVGQAAG